VLNARVYLRRLIAGFGIGIAAMTPGVSAGWLAVVLGIFDDLIAALAKFTENPVKHLKMLIPIFIGAGAAVLTLASGITHAFETWPLITAGLLVGLIVGSMPSIRRDAVCSGEPAKKSSWIAGAVSLAAIVAITVLTEGGGVGTGTVYTTLTPVLALYIVAVSALASVAMIVPGVSGAAMLVVFGLYETIFAAIDSRNLVIIGVVAVGAVLGLIGGSKVINALLSRYWEQVYFSILGMMGAVMVTLIWDMGSMLGGDAPVTLALLAFVIGVGISIALSRLETPGEDVL